MIFARRFVVRATAFFMALGLGTGSAFCQVSPEEITKPALRKTEQDYFQKLIELNRAISAAKFPFPLVLSRYAGLDPKQQVGADQRGLEFIDFNGRVVLKISANYNAAFNAHLLTQNQRAGRVLDDVIVPILQLLPNFLSPDSDFDGVGFEISYHARTENKSYTYEGVEVLTVVFNKADAFRFASLKEDADRQEILENSTIYVNGKPFGLALGQPDPEPVDEKAAERSARASSPSPAASSQPDARAILMRNAPATQADADALQGKLQAQLQALDTEGRAHDQFVDYAPPSFVIFRKQIYLQMTMRNPSAFDKNATSIYKRSAQSFDLFLAPRLKTLLDKSPSDPTIAGFDVTVLTEFTANSTSSSEAIEYLLPMPVLRRFVNAEITSQDMIDQSVVLVNGVRIALKLQQAE
jgi:hypothetical protein